uniref:DNA polymerase delta subunit 4 n=1 Tax=Oryza punctata TaxID=4537 RepID=A0A0E0LXK3_ORYPU
MAGGGVKGFYRQKKKGGVAKPSTEAKKPISKKKLPPQNCSQSQDCGDHHGDEVEEQLRLFDMDMTYGPCIGMTRLRRWERAAAMGLRPPPRLRDLLILSITPPPPAHPLPSSSSSPVKILTTTTTSVQAECLWAGKVS